jgi:hypothetical protein
MKILQHQPTGPKKNKSEEQNGKKIGPLSTLQKKTPS